MAVMDIAHIRALAEEYATKYNPEQVAPFPYENILKDREDIEVFFVDFGADEDDASGVTLYKDQKFSILININKPETRQHFTLGHELGHYFLHADKLKKGEGMVDGESELANVPYRHRSGASDAARLEVEANNFAASLLMPADLVRRAWEATESVEKCAGIFKISVVAMSIRLTQLGLVSE